MRRRRLRAGGRAAAYACAVALASSSARATVAPHRSETFLPSSNGLGAIAWNASTWRITQFLEHPYQNPTSTTDTRNFAYDSYPGVVVGTPNAFGASSNTTGAVGTWLSAVQPGNVEYLPGTGIIHVMRSLSGYTLDEYEFAPMGLSQNASVMLLMITNDGATQPITAYSLFNYQLGTGSPTPGNDSETTTYDATNDAYYETGPAGVAMAYLSIPASSFHGSSPNDPYGVLGSAQNLANDPGSGGAVTGAAVGFESAIASLAVGASQTVGWVTVLAPDANGAAAAASVRAWINGRSAAQILSDETSAWAAWQKPAPAGASAEEASVFAESQALLRMGQVTEPAPAGGQILASIAPGEWNITWARDMAYSVVALSRTGHYAEAKAALAFSMGATVGQYQSYVGAPYQISVCRYFGDGTEQSDSNTDGPNIEFDGFGLFLWSLDEYVRASGDTASLAAWWPTIKSEVAGVLLSLQDPTTGLIAADSSIWEVHWDGQQKHFAYTTIAAANGLCSAGRLATAANDAADSATYTAAGVKARDAILHSLRAPDGTIAQSLEGLAAGSGWLDAAVIEAVNFGLFDPTRGTAQATLASIEAGLVPPDGRGFFRDQGPSTYDSSEWIFVDLRMQRAMELHGDTADQEPLFQWNTDQAYDNFGELSELHDPNTADYAGASPMLGFGAGSYLIALTERGTPVTPTCGSFAAEPALDGGSGVPTDDGGSPPPGRDGGSTTTPDAGTSTPDAGSSPVTLDGGSSGGSEAPGSPSSPTSSSGGCSAAGPSSSNAALVLATTALALALARRRRRAV